ncbi:MAG TPA: carboxymuconolactone decarboxylase family protein [Thermoanaerobaculia bacterium]|nr:carboxymuconolactone decarboxylase family protein [Thermoanaerobaculia bacterium]
MSEPQGPFITLPTDEELRSRMTPGGKTTYNFGFISSMGRLLAAHPRIGPAMRDFFYEVMFAPGALDRGEREMVAAVTSAAQSCEF